jgi:acetyl-CoA carboxylase carboxyltransferase component
MFMDISSEDLGGAAIHAQKSGVAHYRAQNEKECFEKVKELLNYIPHYYGDKSPFAEKTEKAGLFAKKDFTFSSKKLKDIQNVLPESSTKGYDIKAVIENVIDDGTFYEIMPEFAANAVVGFGKIEGKTVGIVGNNPGFFGGVLNCDASDKISRFVRYCDCYDIPLLTFVDVPGFIPGPQEEQKGIIRHGAKLLYAYSEASVPKVTVITRKAYGGAYIAMCSKHLGADFVYAWPKAEIAVMGAEGAIGILYAKEAAPNVKAQKGQEYRETFMTPTIAAQRDYISAVINPEETRAKVVQSFKFLEGKTSSDVVSKKHGNIPL